MAELWPGPTLEQSPAAHEHESNGVVESGVKVSKGILRAHLLALDSRIQGRVPCGHPVFAWLVQHSSGVLAKSLVGKDGRTPYGRLFGKEVAEEAFEIGEVLRWRLPRLVGHNTLLEARWHAGVWLGRLGASPVHIVYDLTGKSPDGWSLRRKEDKH